LWLLERKSRCLNIAAHEDFNKERGGIDQLVVSVGQKNVLGIDGDIPLTLAVLMKY
jgi:hypothetical protein